MISALISRLVILVFGTLYPAYSSYKAVKTKDIKLYVKWMMYWIVFALFTAAETFTDIFFSFWFPFYYELKVIIVIWLLSPVTRGSSIMYRRVIHPLFMRREQEIDELIAKAKDQGYNVILDIGCKGMTLATNAIMSTAVKGGSGILFQLKKSYSLNDLNSTDRADGSKDEPSTRKIKDCRDNFHGYEKTPEKKMTNEHQNSGLTNADSRIFHQHSMLSHNVSNENITFEKDCENIALNVRPRKNTRQECEKLGAILQNHISPYSAVLPYHGLTPFFPYAFPKHENLAQSQPTTAYKHQYFNLKNGNSSDINSSRYVATKNIECLPISIRNPEQCYRGYLTLNVANIEMKKANSTPDIRFSSLAGANCTTNFENSPKISGDKSLSVTTNIRKKHRRKRTAPKPPDSSNREKINSNVPLICVDCPVQVAESKPVDHRRYPSTEEMKTGYLSPTPLVRPRRKQYKSKIQHFLSKSRELLTQWKNEDTDREDSYSVQSDMLAASSDDSVSSSSSYNTTLAPLKDKDPTTLPRKRQTKKRTI